MLTVLKSSLKHLRYSAPLQNIEKFINWFTRLVIVIVKINSACPCKSECSKLSIGIFKWNIQKLDKKTQKNKNELSFDKGALK